MGMNPKPTKAQIQQYKLTHVYSLRFILASPLTEKARSWGCTDAQWTTLQFKARKVLAVKYS